MLPIPYEASLPLSWTENVLLNFWRIHGLLKREREQVRSQKRTGS